MNNLNNQMTLDTKINIRAILKEAWHKVKGSKFKFMYAFVVYFILFAVINIGIKLVFPKPSQDFTILTNYLLIGTSVLTSWIAVSFILMPLIAGVIKMGIFRAKDLPIKVSMIFSCYTNTLKIGIGVLFIILVTFVPLIIFISFINILTFLLAVIWGLYFSISYCMFIPLIIEKKLGIWQALETSRRTVTKHWFKIFGLLTCKFIINIISALPLGIGLIWTLPLNIISFGVLYRRLFEAV